MTIVAPGVFTAVFLERLKARSVKARRNISTRRRFVSYFGVDEDGCALLWNKLYQSDPAGLVGWKPHHLLDALFFLKVYVAEEVAAGFAGCDEKTLRKWNWTVLQAISNLTCINFNNRYRNDNGSICRITLDGTDFRITEPNPFSPKWYSHKFKGPGLRYEVGMCIQTGEIVWVNGPFPCGDWPDLRIARHEIIYLIDHQDGEMILADGGYRDGEDGFFETPTGQNNPDQAMKQLARARHETVNRRFKVFNCMKRVWRHGLGKHGIAFQAVVNITHLLMAIEGSRVSEHGSFQIYYKDN